MPLEAIGVNMYDLAGLNKLSGKKAFKKLKKVHDGIKTCRSEFSKKYFYWNMFSIKFLYDKKKHAGQNKVVQVEFFKKIHRFCSTFIK